MYVANPYGRNSETLSSLRAVFDECLQKVESIYGECARSTFIQRRELIAIRIIDLAEQGVTDPELLKKKALVGLLPESRR
jgi:hypothetical protein